MKPQMNADEKKLNELTEKIIGCAYQVGNTLGCRFLEKVYENALIIEMKKKGPSAEQQFPISVKYDGKKVGDYVADLIVENKAILEIKAVKRVDDVHIAQCMNYLRATGIIICLLINFGKPKVEIKRIVYEL